MFTYFSMIISQIYCANLQDIPHNVSNNSSCIESYTRLEHSKKYNFHKVFMPENDSIDTISEQLLKQVTTLNSSKKDGAIDVFVCKGSYAKYEELHMRMKPKLISLVFDDKDIWHPTDPCLKKQGFIKKLENNLSTSDYLVYRVYKVDDVASCFFSIKTFRNKIRELINDKVTNGYTLSRLKERFTEDWHNNMFFDSIADLMYRKDTFKIFSMIRSDEKLIITRNDGEENVCENLHLETKIVCSNKVFEEISNDIELVHNDFFLTVFDEIRSEKCLLRFVEIFILILYRTGALENIFLKFLSERDSNPCRLIIYLLHFTKNNCVNDFFTEKQNKGRIISEIVSHFVNLLTLYKNNLVINKICCHIYLLVCKEMNTNFKEIKELKNNKIIKYIQDNYKKVTMISKPNIMIFYDCLFASIDFSLPISTIKTCSNLRIEYILSCYKN